jgi:hypothetical protein
MPDTQDPHDVNMIPAGRLQVKRLKARWRLWARVGGAYGVLLAVVLLSSYALWNEDDRTVLQELQSASQRIQNGTASVIEARKNLAVATAAFQASQVIKDQPDWSRLLALLADDLGEDVVLNGCRLLALDDQAGDLMARIEPLQGTSAASLAFGPRQYQLQMTGFGKTRHSVSEFTLRLERTGLFSTVRCVRSDRQSFLDGEAMAFTVECQL